MHGKYHPMPNIALSEAIPVGVESICEYIQIESLINGEIGKHILKRLNAILPRGMKFMDVVESRLNDMVKDYAYILISNGEIKNGELKLWRRYRGKYFYLWKGKSIKVMREKGNFNRIVKVMDRRANGF